MASIFLGVLIVFNVSSCEFHQAVTLSVMMSGPSSPDLNSLDYHVWGKAGVIILQAAMEAKSISQIFRCTLADLVCLARENY